MHCSAQRHICPTSQNLVYFETKLHVIPKTDEPTFDGFLNTDWPRQTVPQISLNLACDSLWITNHVKTRWLALQFCGKDCTSTTQDYMYLKETWPGRRVFTNHLPWLGKKLSRPREISTLGWILSGIMFHVCYTIRHPHVHSLSDWYMWDVAFGAIDLSSRSRPSDCMFMSADLAPLHHAQLIPVKTRADLVLAFAKIIIVRCDFLSFLSQINLQDENHLNANGKRANTLEPGCFKSVVFQNSHNPK